MSKIELVKKLYPHFWSLQEAIEFMYPDNEEREFVYQTLVQSEWYKEELDKDDCCGDSGDCASSCGSCSGSE